MDAFVDTLAPKLANCWKDLHAFSCLSNMAYQTTRKLSPDTYNEVMISVLYRLTHLCFEVGSPQETIRIGLLVFSSTIFLMPYYTTQPYGHLLDLFTTNLLELYNSRSATIPEPIMLWLVVLYNMVIYKEHAPESRHTIWLDKAVSLSMADTWSQIHNILKSVMWVDFIHDSTGNEICHEALKRLGETQ